ncbi:MAG: 50S ribosomal protein L10 [Ardenticatenaceae bacterium]
MAISRQQKEEFVAVYTDKLSRCEAAYLADYRGMTVAQISDFRGQLREESNAEFTVAKNRLLKIALQQTGWAVPEEHLKGPTAILFCFEDPVTPAKVLTRYAKKNDIITIKGGVMGQQVMGIEGVEGMAKLPGREEILATLIGTLQAPAQNLFRTLQAPAQELFGTLTAPLRELSQVLKARSEESEKSE